MERYYHNYILSVSYIRGKIQAFLDCEGSEDGARYKMIRR